MDKQNNYKNHHADIKNRQLGLFVTIWTLHSVPIFQEENFDSRLLLATSSSFYVNLVSSKLEYQNE